MVLLGLLLKLQLARFLAQLFVEVMHVFHYSMGSRVLL